MFQVRQLSNCPPFNKGAILFQGRPFVDCVTFAKNFVEHESGGVAEEDMTYLDSDRKALYVYAVSSAKYVHVCVEMM